MARIGFLLLPEPGHIFPTFRLSKTLEARGHNVSYISTKALEECFRHYGFQTHRILPEILPASGPADLLDATAVNVTHEELLNYSQTIGVGVPDLLASEIRLFPIDILVCDSAIMTRLGAQLWEALDVPVISLSLALPEPAEEHPPGRQIVLCPRELEALPRGCLAGPDNTFYAEPSIYRERSRIEFPWDRLSTEQFLVYCSLGTQSARYKEGPEVLRNIVAAFESMPDLRLVVSAGNNANLAPPDDIPPNVLLVRKAPQLELLACASVFVTNGGLGSLKESIMSGVPAVVIPFDMDQPGNAERVEHHGIGVRCNPADCTTARIRELLTSVVADREMQFRTREMRTIFWAREMQAPAAKLIAEVCDASTCR